MSRICVKNLPAYVSDAQLKEHFASKCEVTDAKVIKTKDGKSRNFGFVGFRTEDDAKSALKFYNKSFLGTSRLVCEVARGVTAAPEVRPWSRYSKGSSAYEKSHKQTPVSEAKSEKKSQKKDGDSKEDPLLAEFLSVVQPRMKTQLWANDTVVAPANVKVNQADLAFEDSDSDDDGEASVMVEDGTKDDDDGDFPDEDDAAVSNAEYLKSRMTGNWDGEEMEDQESEEDEDEDEEGVESMVVEAPEPAAEKSQKTGAEKPEKTSTEIQEAGQENGENETESGRLFIRNLAFTTGEEELTNLFEKYGELSQVHIVLDRETNRSKGFAYVMFAEPEAASRALKELDMSVFQGRLLHILPAKKQPSAPERPKGPATFKTNREADRKEKEAKGNTKSWNPLYMRPDTVAENVAKEYGLTKREFLNPEAEDLAVRLALGETHIIADTKRNLASQGVNVEVLEEVAMGKAPSKVARSNHAIVVKNLPFSTTEEELMKLFGSHGNIGRLVLPHTKAVAIVEYLEASEARNAFQSLAYRRFKHVPLYLEWAPASLLHPKGSLKSKESAESKKNPTLKAKEQLLSAAEDESNEADISTGRSVFVKNLNFKTAESGLRQHFEKNLEQGSLRKATVKTKPSKKGDKVLSMGFGFLEFESVETAQYVCKNLQGTVLDGHALVLNLSHGDRKAKAPEAAKRKDNLSSTKIIVRNVAFEATKKDLRQLFSPFGQMKSLKLPKKFDGKHRGFGFVEFVTKQEAKNAFEALASTHLYGRHLVLEWAKEDETLEELRARTASQFFDDEQGARPTKKQKLVQ